MTDTELTRLLAERVMGWEIYTEQEGQYDNWQRHLVKDGGADSCFIDIDGRAWIYDGPAPYINVHERLWRPLQSMDDAWMAVEKPGEQGWTYELVSLRGGHRMAFARLGQHGSRCGTASTPQRAICLAALRTAGVEVGDA